MRIFGNFIAGSGWSAIPTCISSVMIVGCGGVSGSVESVDTQATWVTTGELVLQGYFRTRPQYRDVEAGGASISETLHGRVAVGTDFAASEFLPPEYWVDTAPLDDLASRMSQPVRVRPAMVRPTLQLRITVGGLMTIEVLEVDSSDFVVPFSVGPRDGRLAMWAVPASTPDGMDLLVARKVVEPSPGSMVLHFDQFSSDNATASRLVVSTQSGMADVVLALGKDGDDFVLTVAQDK